MVIYALLRRLLRVPWTARRSNQSILKEINPGISLEGMMLKLKLQYFVHLMRRVDSLEKTHAGEDWGQDEKGTTEDEMAGRHHWLDGCECEWTPGVGDGQGGLACCDSWGHKESDMTEQLPFTSLHFWCWEGLGAGGEGDDRRWDGWMASLTRWTWVWVNSGSWWWTGRPGMLWFMGSQRVRHDWATELNWTEVPELSVYRLWVCRPRPKQVIVPQHWAFSVVQGKLCCLLE